MARAPSQDRLLNLLKMEREVFLGNRAHLGLGEQERQWAARAAVLTSALRSATAFEPADVGSTHPTLPPDQHRGHPESAAPSSMARRHSVIMPAVLTGLPRADFGIG